MTGLGRVLGGLGVLAIACGLLAWVWLGDWRWAATGLIALAVLAGIGSSVDSTDRRDRT